MICFFNAINWDFASSTASPLRQRSSLVRGALATPRLMKPPTIPNLPRRFLQEFIHMLSRLRLPSSLRLNPVRDLNRRSQTHFRIQFPPPAQIRLNQDQLIRRRRAHPRRRGTRSARGILASSILRRPHLLRRLLVHHHRARHKIPQSSALPVAHHAHQAHSVDSRHSIHGPHQIPSDRLERIDRPARLLDHPNARKFLPRRLPLPKNLEDRKISPIHREPNKNGHSRPNQARKKVEYRKSQRHEEQKNNSSYEIQRRLD